MSELININKSKIDFNVTIPKLYKNKSNEQQGTVRLKYELGEYVYIPRAHTFLCEVRYCVEELEAIIKKMKELNRSKDK